MAKQLGQIHTVNFDAREFVDTGDSYLCDMSKELTQQLGHMVRNATIHKVVGIDLAVSQYGSTGSASISGFIRYYAPTKGRIQAYKNAYDAIRRGMKLNGVNVAQNKLYDFRVPLNDRKFYLNGDSFVNQAAIGGTDGLGELSLGDGALSGMNKSVFEVYNLDRQPVSTTTDTPTFSAGYNILSPSGEISDFVSNEGFYWDGMKDEANLQMETIPFQLAWTPTSDDTAFTFQWRPDPALYLSMMCGQFDIIIDELDSSQPMTIDVAVHVAGWKPLLGGKKPARKSKSKRRRRKSKK
jgi:hypothetical protein